MIPTGCVRASAVWLWPRTAPNAGRVHHRVAGRRCPAYTARSLYPWRYGERPRSGSRHAGPDAVGQPKVAKRGEQAGCHGDDGDPGDVDPPTAFVDWPAAVTRPPMKPDCRPFHDGFPGAEVGFGACRLMLAVVDEENRSSPPPPTAAPDP